MSISNMKNSNINLNGFGTSRAEYSSFADHIAIQEYDSRTGLFYSNNSIGFILECAVFVGMDERQEKAMLNSFKTILPVGCSVQIMLYADPDISSYLNKWAASRTYITEEMNLLTFKREEYLLKLAASLKDSKVKPRNFRSFISVSFHNSLKISYDEIAEIKTRLQTSFKTANLSHMELDGDELVKLLYTLLNPEHYGKNLKTKWNKDLEISEQIVSSDTHMFVTNDGCIFNNKVSYRSFSVEDFPNTWEAGMMSELIGSTTNEFDRMTCPFIMQYGFTILNSEYEKLSLINKASIARKNTSRTLVDDNKKIHEDCEIANYHHTQGHKYIRRHFQILLMAGIDEIENQTHRLKSLFANHNWQIQMDKYFALPAMLNIIPTMWGEKTHENWLTKEVYQRGMSSEVMALAPIQGEWRGTETPCVLFSGRRGQISNFNLFRVRSGNFNLYITGISGAGKSMLMQEINVSILAQGGRVFVLDIGRSYEKSCRLLGGEFIEFKTNSNMVLNPFSSINSKDGEDIDMALEMVCAIISKMVAPFEGTDDYQNALINNAVSSSFEQYVQNTSMDHIYDHLHNLDDIEAKRLAVMLQQYTSKGRYGSLLNGQSNIDFKSNFVVIEFEELNQIPTLQAVVFQIFTMQIINQLYLGDRTQPFAIVIDEAHATIAGKQDSIFVGKMARRVRKYGGSLIIGTQNIDDYLDNPGLKAAYDNSNWHIYMKQGDESLKKIRSAKEFEHLSPMVNSIASLETIAGEYSEAVIKGEDGYAIQRLVLDPFSQMVYSTQAKDFNKINALVKQGRSMRDAIEECVNDKQRRNKQ